MERGRERKRESLGEVESGRERERERGRESEAANRTIIMKDGLPAEVRPDGVSPPMPRGTYPIFLPLLVLAIAPIRAKCLSLTLKSKRKETLERTR